jgi:pimeloyl-ACP methyl ester carboxylesterase
VPARLHHERIARSGSAPSQALLLTHGIYGAGSNWRSIARRLVERRPQWAVELVDLRQHGRSEPGDPPHDIAACAGDLAALAGELGDVRAIAGHSFGGKVVLATRALAPAGLRQTWVLDASPSARPAAEGDPDNLVAGVLRLMEGLPRTWATREEFVAAVEAAGHERPLAQWLAMNLVPAEQGRLASRLDLGAIRAMLADYYARDLWPALLDPALPGEVELVIADRSPSLIAADRARLAEAPPHVHVHHIEAGHWLHIDAPGAVVDLFARQLP